MKNLTYIANLGFASLLALFFSIYISAWKTDEIVIRINDYGEKYIEFVLLIILALLSIFIFIKEFKNEL